MFKCTVPALLLAACLLTLPTAHAQTPPPMTTTTTITTPPTPPAPADQVQFATERVVVFKDGYALMVKSATATADASGRVFTPDVPDDAVLGCFWASSDRPEQKLGAMKCEWRDDRALRKTPAPALTIRELLRANLGKKVTLTLTDDKADKTRTATGTLAEILETPANPDARLLPPAQPDAAPFTLVPHNPRSPFEDGILAGTIFGRSVTTPVDSTATLTRELTPRGGDFLVLDGTESGKLVAPIAAVRIVGGEALTTQTTREEEVFTRAKRLSFDFGPAAAGKPIALHIFYFTPGIRWIPTYRVTGELQDKADLALQAEVVNDLENIDHAALDLVVGVPNFRFKEVVSPLTLESTMRHTLALARDNNYNGQYLQVSNNANFVANDEVREPMRFARPVGPAELTGTGEQDLFVYPLKDFSLAKGARASLPLWQNNTPLRHLYTYDLKTRRSRFTGGKIDLPDSARSPDASPLQISLNRVWHQLELTNATETPWTTGAALMLKGQLPLGQDLLTYTSPGGSTLLPVTIAVDLRATSDEEESERHANALRIENYDYALVKKKGTITLSNFRKEKALFRVSLSTGGKVDSASDTGKIKINDFRADDWDDASYMRPNNHSDVTWEITVDPAQSKTLTYTLSSYIR